MQDVLLPSLRDPKAQGSPLMFSAQVTSDLAVIRLVEAAVPCLYPLTPLLQLRRDLCVISELTGYRVVTFQVIFLTTVCQSAGAGREWREPGSCRGSCVTYQALQCWALRVCGPHPIRHSMELTLPAQYQAAAYRECCMD